MYDPDDLVSGNIRPRTDDPAFQPPRDPIGDIPALRARALVVHREIPNISVQQGWDVNSVRAALVDLTQGLFDAPSQLYDAISADSRVRSALQSRSGGLLGRDVEFRVPRKLRKDDRAKKCQRRWEDHWQHMGAEPEMLDLLETADVMAFGYKQLLWDTGGDEWRPFLFPFSTRYSYFHWLLRDYIAITQDGQYRITGGDGHWVLHAPYGHYRGWMRGALRALAQWVLARDYALRDFARYCERHGFPIILADTPFGADPSDIANYAGQLSALGQESLVQLPGSVDLAKYGRYDLRYLEPKDETWQSFKALIEVCNDEITLILLGQNLTSQVKEGTFAAARVHADVRQAILESDARSFERTIYTQILRPFAALNFGDAELAPIPHWDVSPAEDYEVKARTTLAFSQGMNQLRLSGVRHDTPEGVRKFAATLGLDIGKLVHVDPTAVASRLVTASGQDTGEDTVVDGTPAEPPK